VASLLGSNQYNVLICDDDQPFGEMLGEFLKVACNCTVTLVASEEELWPVIQGNHFDILFLDYQLPNSNGLEILKKITRSGIGLPTVMMTGQGSEQIAAKAIQSGALEYLVKGEYSFSSLQSLIERAVQLSQLKTIMQESAKKIQYQATILNGVRDAVVVWGVSGEITYWNREAEHLYGMKADQMVGKSIYEAYFPLFTPFYQFPINFDHGIYQSEHWFRSDGNHQVWVSSQISVLTNDEEDSRPLGYMDVTRDITTNKKEQQELIKSQHLIHRILETSPDIIYLLKMDRLEFSYVSQKVETLLGLRVEEMIGEKMNKLFNIHPDDAARLVQHYASLMNLPDNDFSEIEFRIRTRTGEDWTWLKARETVFGRNLTGRVDEVIGVFEDITQHKQMDDRLKIRLQTERVLSQLSGDLIGFPKGEGNEYLVDALERAATLIQARFGMVFMCDGNSLQSVAAYTVPLAPHLSEVFRSIDLSQQKFQWNIEDLSIQPVIAAHPIVDLPLSVELRNFLLQLGVRFAVVSPMIYDRSLSGVVFLGLETVDKQWERDHDYLIRTFGQLLLKALIQKRVSEELRSSEERYRAIVEDHQTEMICRFSDDLLLNFTNETFCRYYDIDRTQLLGTSFLAPIRDADKETVRNTIADLNPSSPIVTISFQVLKKDKVQWQEWVIRAIADNYQGLKEFQAVGRDITDRKQMEEQIQAAQTRLAQTNRLASIGQLASSVAHQISNPLTTIIADGQLLLQVFERGGEDWLSAKAIVDAGWRAQQVINELLKFSTSSEDTHGVVYISETLEKSLLLSSPHIQAAGIDLKIDLSENELVVSGSSRQLVDLWLNLLLTIVSLTKERSENVVLIEGCVEDESVVVKFTQDGVTISSEEAEMMFEPQLVPTSAKWGTGMELTICREIVRQHNGEISVHSENNAVVYIIRLPKAADVQE
jgi:PAS domain S-box-containing protein